jgi:hypothetical protein
MATRYCSTRPDRLKSFLLVLLLLPVLAHGQAGGEVLDHLQWLPAGSYVGYVHAEIGLLHSDFGSIAAEIIEELDFTLLPGTKSSIRSLTVGLLTSIDMQRQRQLERAGPTEESGKWFWEEISIVSVTNLSEIIKKQVEAGSLEPRKPIAKIPVFRYSARGEEERNLWVGRISQDSLVITEERNRLVSALRAGRGITASVMDDVGFVEFLQVIPKGQLWFFAPQRLTLERDLAFSEQAGESKEVLTELERELKKEAIYRLISLSFDSELSVRVECAFDDNDSAIRYLKADPDWYDELMPFDSTYYLEIIDDHSGPYLRSTIMIDQKKLLQEQRQKKQAG